MYSKLASYLSLTTKQWEFAYEIGLQFAKAEGPHTNAKNLGVVILECNASGTPGAFCEEFLFFKSNQFYWSSKQ